MDRGGRRVFAGLTFSVSAGTALIVTGPNGVGKSSLLRTLAGLVAPAEGDLNLEGASQPDMAVHEHAHYFGHQDALKPALTALENLTFWQSFSAPAPSPGFKSAVMKPVQALEFLGIGHTARLPAAYLSAGQRRRLSLARLLITPRPLWLMDEPTSALDTASEARLLDLMNNHLSGGGIIIAATHSPLNLSTIVRLHLETAPEPMAPLSQERDA
ncbi:cytochrome c biogenesis ATP-binding export protein CcmA [Roseibium aquae]|uniref:Cytochrome c biogenesis ATP-binding export protein CcmA n=1 Tax=Roseibium aquae TaxID=1323746 RepID=A0A916WYA9_9HYPH|nr:cytochrome c biogenesis ATP-binding export protein CcmA [Roseibium aquae]